MGFVGLSLKQRFFPWKQAEAFYRTRENSESAVRLLHGLQLGNLPLQASTDSRYLAWISKPEDQERAGGHFRFSDRLNRSRDLEDETGIMEHLQPVVRVDEHGIQRHMPRGNITHYPQAGYSLLESERAN